MSPTRQAVWKAFQATPGLGLKRLARLALRLTDNGITAVELVGCTAPELVRLGLSAKQAEAAVEALARVEEFGPDLSSVLVPGDPDYPAHRLSDAPALPVVLHYLGNVHLLSRPTIGFAGSRDADPETVELVDQLVRSLSGTERTIVSGNARGVDAQAHQAAISSGLPTIAVLAEGLHSFTPTWAGGEPDVSLAISQFPDQTPWKPRYAMQRNETIAALSDIVVVVSAGETGGSLAMGNLCLKVSPLAVPAINATTAPGNHALLQAGAIELPIDDVVEARRILLSMLNTGIGSTSPSQGSLFDNSAQAGRR